MTTTMSRLVLRAVVPLAILVPGIPAPAQQGGDFRQAEHAINAGGDPRQVVLSSPDFRVTLDAVGDACPPTVARGPGFRLETGFVSAYAPPGEVQQLMVQADRLTLSWNPDPSAGTYDLHGGPVSALGGPGGYGACLVPHIEATHTTDSFVPVPGTARLYLVTVENRVGEEGTLGRTSSGATRPNALPCP